MKCDVCGKEFMFLYFIGKTNVCNKCIAKYTVFKEVKNSEDGLLRKAIRAFDVADFEELKHITNSQLDELEMGTITDNKEKKTFKYKKNNSSSVVVDGGDALDYQSEYDASYE